MKVKLAVLLIVCVMLTGCVRTEQKQESGAGVSFTDSMGNTVTVSEAERVGICSGSLAECWLLAGGEICAVTRDAVTERKLELPEEYMDLGSLKEPSAEAILAADLDFLIMMSSLPNHVALAETLEKVGLPHAYFDVENFADYLELMKLFTDITGRKDLYELNAVALQEQIDEVIENGRREDAPEVLLLRASSSTVKALDSSFMTGGMLKELGCINIADNEDGLLKELSIEAIVNEDPDYIFVTCMGDMEAGMAQLESALLSNPVWKTLQAVKNERVFYLEKELFHNKPNARWGESYEILAQFLAQ